jgi:CheY-like chemotaxis protein
MFKNLLENAGFEYSFSHNYTDAVDHIVKNIPYIVILDLHIPKTEGLSGDMYGHELLEVINKESRGTQSIVITGESDERIIEHIKKFNPVRILTKPVTISDVEAALSVAVARVVR